MAGKPRWKSVVELVFDAIGTLLMCSLVVNHLDGFTPVNVFVVVIGSVAAIAFLDRLHNRWDEI